MTNYLFLLLTYSGKYSTFLQSYKSYSVCYVFPINKRRNENHEANNHRDITTRTKTQLLKPLQYTYATFTLNCFNNIVA